VGSARVQESASDLRRKPEPTPAEAASGTAAAPLAGVPAGPAGQALLSRLARAAGNRSVGALLQRDAREELFDKLRASAGWKAMSPAEASRFYDYIAGKNREISQPAYTAFAAGVKAGTIDLSKIESMRKFFTDQSAAPAVVSPAPGAFEGKRAPYTVGTATEVKNYEFRSKKADAQKYDVSVGDKEKIVVPVYRPKTPDATAGHIPTVDDVAKGLASLPQSSLKLVTKVHVEPAQNPADAHWATVYKRPGFRSYMTAGEAGVIAIYPTTAKTSQEYLEGTMIHETGHTLSKKQWGEESDKRWQPWKDAMKSDVVVASQYAKASPGEDFGETLQAYFQVKGTPAEKELRALMPARMKIIDGLLAPKKP
jgi:hypothetical protein